MAQPGRKLSGSGEKQTQFQGFQQRTAGDCLSVSLSLCLSVSLSLCLSVSLSLSLCLSLSLSLSLMRFARGFALFKGRRRQQCGEEGTQTEIWRIAHCASKPDFIFGVKLTCRWEYHMACLQLLLAFKTFCLGAAAGAWVEAENRQATSICSLLLGRQMRNSMCQLSFCRRRSHHIQKLGNNLLVLSVHLAFYVFGENLDEKGWVLPVAYLSFLQEFWEFWNQTLYCVALRMISQSQGVSCLLCPRTLVKLRVHRLLQA